MVATGYYKTCIAKTRLAFTWHSTTLFSGKYNAVIHFIISVALVDFVICLFVLWYLFFVDLGMIIIPTNSVPCFSLIEEH